MVFVAAGPMWRQGSLPLNMAPDNRKTASGPRECMHMSVPSVGTSGSVASGSGETRQPFSDLRTLSSSIPVHVVSRDGAGQWNERMYRRFQVLRDDAGTRRSHYFQGRFENVYPERAAMPEVECVLEWAAGFARRICREPALRCGFWFNEMAHGQCTGVHTHDDDDEILSAVYYVTAPAGSGALLLHARAETIRVLPRPGLLVFFPPDVPHEVETHNARDVRLSLAMNFGPAS